MEHVCVVDIETIPTQSPDVIERYKAEVKAPGNIKKPESIDAWMVENRDRVAAENIAKTSFDPAAGHICTIGWATDDDDPVAAHTPTVEGERDVIEAFYGSLTPLHKYTFVGHNIAAFDIRFLLCRSVVLGIRIPQCIPRDPKPWDRGLMDTMTAWAGQRGTISMDRLCDALSLPGKGGFDGPMVADAWANGEHDRIAEYCKSDVEKTREIWRRFEAAGW